MKKPKPKQNKPHPKQNKLRRKTKETNLFEKEEVWSKIFDCLFKYIVFIQFILDGLRHKMISDTLSYVVRDTRQKMILIISERERRERERKEKVTFALRLK